MRKLTYGLHDVQTRTGQKILRRIYEPDIDSDIVVRRLLYNEVMRSLFQRPDIIAKITKRRLM